MNAFRITTLIAIMGLGLGAAACKKTEEVEALGEDQAQDPAALFNKGIEYLKPPSGDPNYELAYDHFVKSANIKDGAKVQFNAGWTAERLGKLDVAEGHYRKAQSLDPAYDKAMFSLARVLGAQGKNAEVVALYSAQVEKNPDNIGLRTDLINALSKSGDFAGAQAQAQEILRRDPDNADVYRSLSTMYFDQDKLALSQLANEKALSITDADPGIYNNMGVTYVLQKDNQRAIERFKTAIKIAPKHFEANMNLGFIALDSGDYGLAQKCFQAATESNPQSEDAKLGLAVALRGMQDYESADKLYREIIKANPKNDQAYFNGSTLHEKYTKEFKKAEKFLDDYIASHQGEVGPEHPVYERKTRIQKSIAEEKARQEAIAQQEREEAERKKRNEKLLADLKADVEKAKARVPQCNDDMVKEMAGMYIMQVEEAMQGEDAASMAGDLKSFVDEANMSLDSCTPGGDAGGAEGGEPAPQ